MKCNQISLATDQAQIISPHLIEAHADWRQLIAGAKLRGQGAVSVSGPIGALRNSAEGVARILAGRRKAPAY
jgi:hypothetical protein